MNKLILNFREIKLIKELVELAIDTRTPIESDDTPFASMTNLLKKLEGFQGWFFVSNLMS